MPHKTKSTSINYKGFTLIELSIALTIMGVLAAVVMTGKTVYKQAQLRNVSSTFTKYETAATAFKIQFNSLPGDTTIAHRNWDDGANGVCGTATQCNGNGNGTIEYNADGNDNEFYRGMQHLFLADLLPDYFSGVGNIGVIGTNVGKAHGNNGAIALGSGVLYSSTTFNLFTIAGVKSSAVGSTDWPRDGIFTALDAESIENKIDDGLPGTGKIITARGWPIDSENGRCVDQSILTVTNAVNWVFSDKTESCRIFLKL